MAHLGAGAHKGVGGMAQQHFMEAETAMTAGVCFCVLAKP